MDLDKLKEFFGEHLTQDEHGIKIDGRYCRELEFDSDFIVRGFYEDYSEICAINQFGHLEIGNSFEICDKAMQEWEFDHFTDTLPAEFVKTHAGNAQYPIAEYWGWFRRMTVACFEGRWEFFQSTGKRMSDTETPLWFLHQVHERAKEPYRDFMGFISAMIHQYEEKINEASNSDTPV